MDEKVLEKIIRDYSPMTIEEMREKSIEWKCLDDFEAGLQVFTKPEDYKDFRRCIIDGRISLRSRRALELFKKYFMNII